MPATRSRPTPTDWRSVVIGWSVGRSCTADRDKLNRNISARFAMAKRYVKRCMTEPDRRRPITIGRLCPAKRLRPTTNRSVSVVSLDTRHKGAVTIGNKRNKTEIKQFFGGCFVSVSSVSFQSLSHVKRNRNKTDETVSRLFQLFHQYQTC